MTMTSVRAVLGDLRGKAGRFSADRRGAVAMIYAIVFIAVLTALGVGVDLSDTLQLKYRLDLAADAAAIACGEAWQTDMQAGFAAVNSNPNPTSAYTTLLNKSDADATVRGQYAFQSQAAQVDTQLTSSTGLPVVTFSHPASTTAPTFQCLVNYTATQRTYIMQVVGFKTLTISGSATSLVNLSPYANVYFVLDTSGSMMVGDTQTDNGKIANWVYNNITQVEPGGNNATFAPCSFSCHDVGNPKVADLQKGETNAHAAGATTRFDVLLASLTNDPLYTTNPTAAYSTSYNSTLGEGILPYIRDTYGAANARANLNGFLYNAYGFNTSIKKQYSTLSNLTSPPYTDDTSQGYIENQTSLQAIASTINALTIGLDTRWNEAVANQDPTSVGISLETIVGTVATPSTKGTTADNPLKFVILVSDGMNSWRANDGCPGAVTLPQSGYSATLTCVSTLTGSIPNQCSNWATICTTNAANLQTACTSGICNIPLFTWTNSSDYPWNGSVNQSYVGPFDNSYCTYLKNNGVVVAVLETPYVPLFGEDPGVFHNSGAAGYAGSYERNGLYAQYPNGYGTQSALTYGNDGASGLKGCASPGYYYQASSDTAISTGFVTLFNQFVGQWVHVIK